MLTDKCLLVQGRAVHLWGKDQDDIAAWAAAIEGAVGAAKEIAALQRLAQVSNSVHSPPRVTPAAAHRLTRVTCDSAGRRRRQVAVAGAGALRRRR